MPDDFFDYKPAISPQGGIVPRAEADVYSITDIAFGTPLPITDVNGIPLAKLVASPDGVFPQFKVIGEPEKIIIKAGSLVTALTSENGRKGEKGEPGDPGAGLIDPSTLPDGYVPVVTAGEWGAGPLPTGGGSGDGYTLRYKWNGSAYVDSNGQIPPNAKPAGRIDVREFLTNGDKNAPFPTYPSWPDVESRWLAPEEV